MTYHGLLLRAYINKTNIKPVSVYTSMGISKQAFYKLFESKEFEEETIKKIEIATGTKWETIKKVNIDPIVPHGTPHTNGKDENKQSLERSIENLTQNELRTTAIIERLVALLETERRGYDPSLPVPGAEGTARHKKTGTKAGSR
jgi:hypothetical protein